MPKISKYPDGGSTQTGDGFVIERSGANYRIERENLSAVKLSSNSPRVYTTNDTWAKPSNLAYAIVELIGGGGSGAGAATTAAGQASAGSGGAGGGYSKKKILAATLGATEAVTIGAGGAGVAGANGNSGGTTSFGTHLQATGGNTGVVSAAAATDSPIGGQPGGVGSNGDINTYGDAGGFGYRAAVAGLAYGGAGGGTTLGGSVNGQTQSSGGNGSAGLFPGGGGQGGRNGPSQGTARSGGNGADGVVIVWEYVYDG